jgi:hypothetical protein
LTKKTATDPEGVIIPPCSLTKSLRLSLFRLNDFPRQAIAARSRQTAQFLATNPDSRRARVGAWYNILTNAIDDRTRQFAAKQIQALGGTIIQKNGAFQVKLPHSD